MRRAVLGLANAAVLILALPLFVAWLVISFLLHAATNKGTK